jgi:hypothetical protein
MYDCSTLCLYIFVGLSLAATWRIFYTNFVQYVIYMYMYALSAATPECLKNDSISTLMATATLPTALLTLLLPLNALKMLQFLLLLSLLLILQPY